MEESPLVVHSLFSAKIFQWHNVIHIVEVLLSAGCAGALVPHIQDSEGLTSTGGMYISLLIYLPYSLVIFPVYYNAEERIKTLDRVWLARHWTIRCTLAWTGCIAYLSVGVIIASESSVPEQPVLVPELVSGVLALVLSVVYIVEALASYQNVKKVSIWELNWQPACCGCSKPREQNRDGSPS